MSEIPKINIPNIAIPTFRTNEVWLNGVPFVPSNDPPVRHYNLDFQLWRCLVV